MITLDLQTFQQCRQGGSITGVIYIELETEAYPETGWSDFPVIILSGWAEALMEMPARREVLWRFMDGPHRLTLTRVAGGGSPGALTYELLETRLLEAMQRVVAYCDSRAMAAPDLEVLRANLLRLQANQTVQGTTASRSAPILMRPSGVADSRR